MGQKDTWRDKLTQQQYHVLREKGTEPPFSGEFVQHDKAGSYHCVACGAELFSSDTKFDAPWPNQGWPSFSDAAHNQAVALRDDTSHGMKRTEVTCRSCGGHLGHLFHDGPSDKGGDHYCINSVCLAFEPAGDDHE
jgi:peptide-methionine (R)-S-oxide reductase